MWSVKKLAAEVLYIEPCRVVTVSGVVARLLLCLLGELALCFFSGAG